MIYLLYKLICYISFFNYAKALLVLLSLTKFSCYDSIKLQVCINVSSGSPIFLFIRLFIMFFNYSDALTYSYKTPNVTSLRNIILNGLSFTYTS